MRVTVAIFAAAVLLLAGCGGGSSRAGSVTASPSPAQTGPFVGIWQGHSKTSGIDYLFRIVRTGSSYRVAANGWTPWPVPLEHGRLILHRYGQLPPRWSHGGGPLDQYGLELAWHRGHVVAVVMARDGVWSRDALTRTSAASYDRQNHRWADIYTPLNTLGLYTALQTWQKQHGGVPPALSELNPSSTFGKWMGAQPRTGVWPTNLYTGTPMQAGTQPGDFTYTTSGSRFTLAVHLSGGKTFLAP